MILPLLVCAAPVAGLKNHTHITPGRWKVEFEGLSYSTFRFLLISPVFPEGFEVDMNEPEFYVDCSTRVSCFIVHVGDEKMISVSLRRIGDGVQHFSNEKRVAGAFG